MIIKEQCFERFKILIIKNNEKAYINYNRKNKTLHIPLENNLSFFLERRRHQLIRIFNHKRKTTFYKGFKLPFVLKDEIVKPVNPFSLDKIAAIDHTTKNKIITWKDTSEKNICEIYTDGSYNEQIKKGAYAVLIKDSVSLPALYTFQSTKKGNNLIELEAIIKALTILDKIRRALITTDSRYVIKGITDWVEIWKRNNWTTANGEKVKNKKYWKKLDRLIKGRYIEFRWVKSHGTCPENNLCDVISRQSLYHIG